MKDTSAADLTIKATGTSGSGATTTSIGEGAGIGFLSTLDTAQREMSDAGKPEGDDYLLKVDNPLVVPVNKKIRIITTADDVIHAWGVPRLGVKQDAIPGFVRDTWFRADKVGDYYGQCYELCGKEHAYMPIHVKVVSQQDYTAWVGSKKKEARGARPTTRARSGTLAPLDARGEQVYTANCQVCHQPNGKGGGAVKPLDASPIVLDADKTRQIHVVLNGQNNGAMPSWKQLSDTEHRGGHHLHQEPLVEQHRPDRAAGRRRGQRASSRPTAEDRSHERSHRTTAAPSTRPATITPTTSTTTTRRTAGGAGCTRPTTRTSARCTCCSRSRCSWSAACSRW